MAFGQGAPLLWRDFGTTALADVIVAGRLSYPVWAVLTGIASLVSVAACGALLAVPRIGVVLAPSLTLATVVVPAFLINDVVLLNRSMSVMSAAYMWSVGDPVRGEQLLWSTQLVQILFFALVGFVAFKVAVGLAAVLVDRWSR